jgi:HEAT repeat protein
VLALAAAATLSTSIAGAQADKHDSKQVCPLDHEVRCLITELSGKGSESARAEAASDLVEALTTADPPLDVQTSLRVREAVLKTLHDRSVDVRVATVTAVGEFGDESLIAALYDVAKSDPVLSLRDYAARAIARARKRLAARPGL